MSWTMTKKLTQRRSRAGRWSWAIEREGGGGGGRERESWTSFALVVSQRRSYGHCLCDSVLHSSKDSKQSLIAVGTAIAWCGGRCAMPDGHCFNILAAVHGSLGLPGWRLIRGFTLLSPFPTRPVLIGLLASVDVKQ